MKNMNPMDFCPNPPDIFLFPFYCSQIFMTVYVTFNEAKKKDSFKDDSDPTFSDEKLSNETKLYNISDEKS